MRLLLSGALLEVKESLTMVFVRQGAEGSDEGKMYARSSQFAHDDAQTGVDTFLGEDSTNRT